MDQSIRSFSDILDEFENTISNLPHGIKIPTHTWIHDARKQSLLLVDYTSKYGLHHIYKHYSKEEVYTFQVSISQIDEINKIFAIAEYFSNHSYHNYTKKVNILLNSKIMPLLPEKESGISNEGRNTHFELRLMTKFIKSGYFVEIPDGQHPDFQFQTTHKKYSVECKRIFSAEEFKSNIEKGIKQLEDYSLKNDNELGIVAINISRYFNINKMGKLFTATDFQQANNIIRQDFLRFKEETLPSFKTITFPIKVPLIIFEYSELGIVQGVLRSIGFTDLSDSQTHSRGFSLYDTLKPDFQSLVNNFKSLFAQ